MTISIGQVRDRLRNRRKALGWSQKQLADAMGTVQSHVSELENGRIGMGVEMLLRWAGALGFGLQLVDRGERQ
jgi:transcriptional regulator with XRE-family HTH domain